MFDIVRPGENSPRNAFPHKWVESNWCTVFKLNGFHSTVYGSIDLQLYIFGQSIL